MPPLVEDAELLLGQDDGLGPAVQSDVVGNGFGQPFSSDEAYEDPIHSDEDVAAQDALEYQLADEEPEQHVLSAPVADMDEDGGDEDGEEDDTIEPTPKKRGRPSLTPKARAAKTPRTSATAPSTSSRARKSAAEAAEEEDDAAPVQAGSSRKRKSAGLAGPPAKRGRASRVAAKSARKALKEAKKPQRGRSKANGTASTKTGKRVRPVGKKKAAEDKVPEDEYEVEKILDSQIDGDSLQHMYHVKWKGYPEDQATWEPKANLTPHAVDMMRKFDAEKKMAAKEAANKEKKEKKEAKPKKVENAGKVVKAVKAVKAKAKTKTVVKAKTNGVKSATKKRGRKRA